MIEIAGEDKNSKADKFASRLREARDEMRMSGGDEGVKISRPSMMAELRVRDIDIFISPGEIMLPRRDPDGWDSENPQ